uniref:Uncharacterized protein n=1 Tax=Glossina brevipalpis TaxID=37001 RepID=A0A1A9W8V4_9MUSC
MSTVFSQVSFQAKHSQQKCGRNFTKLLHCSFTIYQIGAALVAGGSGGINTLSFMMLFESRKATEYIEVSFYIKKRTPFLRITRSNKKALDTLWRRMDCIRRKSNLSIEIYQFILYITNFKQPHRVRLFVCFRDLTDFSGKGLRVKSLSRRKTHFLVLVLIPLCGVFLCPAMLFELPSSLPLSLALSAATPAAANFPILPPPPPPLLLPDKMNERSWSLQTYLGVNKVTFVPAGDIKFN